MKPMNELKKISLDKILRNSHDEGQKRLSTDLQNLKQQIPSKPDFKPILDAIQTLQTSFDKEKTKPDILARKLDSIDQKLKESHPEHMAVIKDIQTKIDPLHKQTSETLTKINDRVKALHTDTSKSHPDIIQKLDQIDQQFKNQQNSLIEPIKQILNEKLNPFIEQQTKKDGEEKLGKIFESQTNLYPGSRR
jgi:iron-sulfur cluster repair protein YtfE (RIC family)